MPDYEVWVFVYYASDGVARSNEIAEFYVARVNDASERSADFCVIDIY